MTALTIPERDPKLFNDYEGFVTHCKVAALILNELGINSHTKHHIREAIREATHKISTRKGGHKKNVDFISLDAKKQLDTGMLDNLVSEHIVTVSFINEQVLNRFIENIEKITVEEITEILLKWTVRALVTKAEDFRLGATNRVKDFSNPMIRYEMVNPPIRLTTF